MTIEDWRKKIDEVDRQIVRLLNERARYVGEIVKLKHQQGMAVYSPEREEEVVNNVIAHNSGPLSQDAVRRVFERIIDESRRFEQEVSQMNY